MLCKGIVALVEISLVKDFHEGGQNVTLNLSRKSMFRFCLNRGKREAGKQRRWKQEVRRECEKIQNRRNMAHIART